jgi:anti-sigma regulatory factor (Ser/Thr protein kinase)
MVYLEARDDLVATAAYQPVPAAAAAARRFVRDTLRSWGLTGRSEDQDALVDDAVLLTSELVTNAVLHAGTPVQVTCRLVGDELNGSVEIAVLDRRPAQVRLDVPQATAEAAERTNGRGLQLPSQLASAWGVTYARAAKAVWFRISLAAAGSAAAAGGTPVATIPAQAAAAESVPGRPERDPPAPEGPRGEPGRPGFDALLVSTVEKARDTIGADSAYLLLQAGGGTGPRPGAAAAAGVSGAGGPPRACAGGAGAAQGRLAADQGGTLPASAARALVTGALSLVTVPLRVDGRVTGVLAAAAVEAGRFSEHDASRLQDLADRSAPVLEQARQSAAGPAPRGGL